MSMEATEQRMAELLFEAKRVAKLCTDRKKRIEELDGLLTKIMGTLGALESQLLFFRPNPAPGALAIIRDAMKEFGKLQGLSE